MHFTAYAYAISNQPTIVPLNESIPTETLGQNIEANALDYQHINVLYCGGKTKHDKIYAFYIYS